MPNVILNEQAQNKITRILNQLPISHLQQAQEIMEVLNKNVERATESDQKPIGGGQSGGSAKPPKSE